MASWVATWALCEVGPLATHALGQIRLRLSGSGQKHQRLLPSHLGSVFSFLLVVQLNYIQIGNQVLFLRGKEIPLNVHKITISCHGLRDSRRKAPQPNLSLSRVLAYYGKFMANLITISTDFN
jgi:hypothetical protein